MGTKDGIARIAVVIALILVASASANAAAPHVDLATADWSISQEQVLNAAPKHSVWEFVNDAWGPGPIIGKLCWFRFADLHHSRELSLAIIYDGGGTADCNDFSVIDKASTGIEEYDFPGVADIKDIKRDGRSELVVGTIFASAGRWHCFAMWPVVYVWNGTGYVDVSGQYKSF
jgi:hypothetical protein